MTKKRNNEILDSEVEERQPNHWTYSDDPFLNMEPVFSDDPQASTDILSQFNTVENLVNDEDSIETTDEVKNKIADIRKNLETQEVIKREPSALDSILNRAKMNSARIQEDVEKNDPTIARLKKIDNALRGRGEVDDDLYTDVTKSQTSTSYYAQRAKDFYDEHNANMKPEESILDRARRLQEEAQIKRDRNQFESNLNIQPIESEFERKMRLQKEATEKRSAIIEANREALGVTNTKYTERAVGFKDRFDDESNLPLVPPKNNEIETSPIYKAQHNDSSGIQNIESTLDEIDYELMNNTNNNSPESLEQHIKNELENMNFKKKILENESEKVDFLKEQARKVHQLISEASKIKSESKNIDLKINKLNKESEKIKADVEKTLEIYSDPIKLKEYNQIQSRRHINENEHKNDEKLLPRKVNSEKVPFDFDYYSNGQKIDKKTKKTLIKPRKEERKEFKITHQETAKTLANLQKQAKKQNKINAKTLSYDEMSNLNKEHKYSLNAKKVVSNVKKDNPKLDGEIMNIDTTFEGLSFSDRRARIFRNANIAAADRVNRIINMRNQQQKTEKNKKNTKLAWDSNYFRQLKNFRDNSNFKAGQNVFFQRLKEINDNGGITEVLDKTLELDKKNQWDINKAYERIAKMSEQEAIELEAELEQTMHDPNREQWLKFFNK
ncbi:hypothetical protein [Spiroplasma endosymbiont of Labia minor]|uniref:hypothetical protein n=1 Tax=Spiroplasma endosymbiont of Labia minor TaxID=3066305 RepID=UPI0030CA8283